MHSLIKSTSV